MIISILQLPEFFSWTLLSQLWCFSTIWRNLWWKMDSLNYARKHRAFTLHSLNYAENSRFYFTYIRHYHCNIGVSTNFYCTETTTYELFLLDNKNVLPKIICILQDIRLSSISVRKVHGKASSSNCPFEIYDGASVNIQPLQNKKHLDH